MLLWFIDEMNPNHQRKIGWVVICPGALCSCYTPYFSTCCCEQTLCGWSSIWGCWPSMQCGSMIQTWFAGRPSIRSSKSDRFCKDSLKSNRCAHSCPEKKQQHPKLVPCLFLPRPKKLGHWKMRCSAKDGCGLVQDVGGRSRIHQNYWQKPWFAHTIYICIYIYIYTSIHLYIHTYIHAYIYIYT